MEMTEPLLIRIKIKM